MPISHGDKPSTHSHVDSGDNSVISDGATKIASVTPPSSQPKRYFERPDPGEKPIGLLRLMVILLSSHIGVRSRSHREEDFRRANGLHVLIAAIVYFLLIIGVLIILVNVIID